MTMPTAPPLSPLGRELASVRELHDRMLELGCAIRVAWCYTHDQPLLVHDGGRRLRHGVALGRGWHLMAGLADGKSPEETVRLAALAAMADPDGFLSSLGHRLAWERARGRTEGIGLALFVVLLVGWLSGRSVGAIGVMLSVAAVVTYLVGWWLGRRWKP